MVINEQPPKNTTMLQFEIIRLESQVKALQRENDELKAELAMWREFEKNTLFLDDPFDDDDDVSPA